MPITMMTLTSHLIAIEADLQIELTGPILESMSSWIERFCGELVEDTRRRLVNFVVLWLSSSSIQQLL